MRDDTPFPIDWSEAMQTTPLSRRQVLRRALLAGAGLSPAIPLLSACGSDDDEPTATLAAGDPTATSGGGDEPTATASDGEPTATTETAEPTATGEPEEPTATTGADDPTATAVASDNPNHFGFEITPGQPGGTLVEGYLSDLSDVAFDADGNPWGVMESLTEIDPQDASYPGQLAESYEISDDLLQWTYTLREGVLFSDGEPLTPDDVVFSFNHYQQIPGDYIAVRVDTIDVLDERTLTINLAEPAFDFLDESSYFPILAEHVIGELTPDEYENWGSHPAVTGLDPSAVVGTGPFRLLEMVPGDHFTLVKNEHYWDGVAYLDEIIVKSVQDEAALITQLQTGEVDFAGGGWAGATNLSAEAVPALEGTDVVLVDFPSISYDVYSFNLDPEKTTLFEDVRVRQALLYAVDRETLIETLNAGLADLAVSTVSPLTFPNYGFDASGVSVSYGYDPEVAAQLLDEAGFTLGDDGIRARDGEPLSFPMLYRSDRPGHEQWVIAIQEYWRQIGVELIPERLNADVFNQRWADHDFISLFARRISQLDQRVVFGCDAYPDGGNREMYCNPELDALYAEAMSIIDRDARNAILTQCQDIVMRDLPTTPLYFLRPVAAYNQRVHNLYPNGWNTWFNAETWWVEQ
jgi:peptide/nickel transport system substrate-binding protein